MITSLKEWEVISIEALSRLVWPTNPPRYESTILDLLSRVRVRRPNRFRKVKKGVLRLPDDSSDPSSGRKAGRPSLSTPVSWGGELQPLSPQERAIAAVLVRARGRPITREQLTHMLWGTDPARHPARGALDVLLTGLRSKMTRGNIRGERGVGWVLEGEIVTRPSLLRPYLLEGEEEIVTAIGLSLLEERLVLGLLVKRGERVTRDVLIPLVWSGRPLPKSPGALDVLILQVRRKLPGLIEEGGQWGKGWAISNDSLALGWAPR